MVPPMPLNIGQRSTAMTFRSLFVGIDRYASNRINELGARLLKREERPVPLNEGFLRADGSFRFLNPAGEETVLAAHIQPQWGKGSSQDLIIPLVRKLVGEGKQVIVFREVRGKA